MGTRRLITPLQRRWVARSSSSDKNNYSDERKDQAAAGERRPAEPEGNSWWHQLRCWATKFLPVLVGVGVLMAVVAVQSPAQALADALSAKTNAAGLQLGASPAYSSVMSYNFQKIMTSGILIKTAAAICAAFPVCVIGGLAYSVAANVPFLKAMKVAYNVASDSPGADIVNEERSSASMVLSTIFLIGLLTYAVFIGIVSDELSSNIQEAKDSNTAVMESGHNVILGWNRVAIPLLKQAAESRAQVPNSIWARPVVIMHEDATPEFRDELLKELGGAKLDIITRQGNPCFLADLARAGTPRAKTVVMLADDDAKMDDDEADDELCLNSLATASNLNVLMKDQKSANGEQLWIVPEKPTSTLKNAWLRTARDEQYAGANGRIVQTTLGRRAHWVAAQCCLQPGLSKVLNSLMRQSDHSSEFYIVPGMDQFAGKPHGVIRQMFPEHVVCGYMHADGLRHEEKVTTGSTLNSLLMNPCDSYLMEQGDRIIVVGANAPALPKGIDETALLPLVDVPAPAETRISGKSIVIIQPTWDDRFEIIMSSLKEFSDPATTSVTVVDTKKPENFKSFARDGFKMRFVKGTITDKDALIDAGIETCDSVMLCAHDDGDMLSKSHDAHTIAAVSLLVKLRGEGIEGAKGKDGKKMHIVGLVNFEETVSVMKVLISRSKVKITGGGLIPDQLLGGIIAQVAAQPELSLLYRELLMSGDGCELYVRRGRSYSKDLERRFATFGELEDTARRRGETMIGYIPSGYIRLVHGDKDVRLGGARSQVVDLDNDSLVVIDK